MAISFSKYVQITSGVGGAEQVARRDLIARLFTTNPLVPTASVVEFTDLADVGTYFGTTSEEYKRASFYFSFISKNITAPQKIGFAHWVSAASAPLIYGGQDNFSLSQFTSITDGSFSLTLGTHTYVVSGLDFSAAGSLSAVAADIQTAIRAESGGGSLFTSATVSYDATRKSFNLTGGAVGAAVIATAAGNVGTNIASLINWLIGDGAILSAGSAVETITQVLTETTETTNNFGSFLFIPALTDDQIVEAAQWNSASDQNVMFQFMVPVTASTASDISGLVLTYEGVAMTLSPTAGEYPEMLPMAIMAATDYEKRDSTVNYMYQQAAGLTPSVVKTVDSNTYDALRVNYYGRTQQAGRFLDFYQRGLLSGIAVDPTDMNTYANEQWFKDAAGVQIMDLLLALAKVSANAKGRSQLIAILQSVINDALFNGTISVGKTLTITQQLFITEITGDPKAWHQVQNSGYWLDCVIEQFVDQSSAVEYKAVYTLVYSKDDVIRKVEGRHILI